MSDRPIRAIIVDDEELARRGIEIRLAAHTDVEIVGHCENGREALETIAREKPDLMFLDIQMPGMSGFDVLARLPHETIPMIVFVTAFDRFALDAFEAQALDYLLKPINDTRFTQALERVRSFWRQKSAIAQRDKLMQLIAQTKGSGSLDEEALRQQLADAVGPEYPEVLPIRDDHGTVRLDVARIDWIDAAGDYMCVHADGKTNVLRETMKSLDAILDAKILKSVHRSTNQNVHSVGKLRPHKNGEYFQKLDNG